MDLKHGNSHNFVFYHFLQKTIEVVKNLTHDFNIGNQKQRIAIAEFVNKQRSVKWPKFYFEDIKVGGNQFLRGSS